MTPTLKELGEQLRQAREGKGLSLKEAAQITKIGPRILEAFELGDRDRFPHRVYAKGFVKNYAKLIGLDPAECGRAMAQALETPEQRAEQELGMAALKETAASPGVVASGAKEKRSSLGILLALLGLVVLLAVLVWYLLLSPVESNQEQETAHQGQAAEEQAGRDASGAAGNPALEQAMGRTAEESGNGVVEAGADLGDVAPGQIPALPPSAHRLEVRALDEQGSWIGVYALEKNAETGEDVLLKDYTVAGTGVLNLTLDEPRNYRFGRIEGVAVAYDGQPQDIEGNGTRNLVFPPRQ